MIPEDGWNENDYNKWRDYPPGKYFGSELTRYPHPRNTCSYNVDGYPVLVTLSPTMVKRVGNDIYYDHTGWSVTVWRPKPGLPITSASKTVTSLDDIDVAVEELKKEVDAACLHKNSESVRPNWPMEHRFKCLDCGEIWGYDSSG